MITDYHMGKAADNKKSRAKTGRSETAGQVIETLERTKAVMKAKRHGWSFGRIQEELGIPKSTAHQIVIRENAITRDEIGLDAKEFMEIERQRLDELHAAHYPAAVGYVDDDTGEPVPPCLKSAKLCLEISESRRELLGLNAAQKVDLTVKVQVTAIAEAQTGAFPLVMERLEAEGLRGEQLEIAARAIEMYQAIAGERLKALDEKPVETEFTEVKGDG